jgi:hypothetical protein
MTVLKKRPARKIWFVAHPTSQFAEDVKMLALTNNLQIIDARFAGDYPKEMHASKTPTLTSLTEKAKAEKAKADESNAAAARTQELADEEAEIERKITVEIAVRARVMAKMAEDEKKAKK